MESEVERAEERTAERETNAVMKKEYVVQDHPVIEELKTLNVEQISPIEALNLLYEVKKKLGESP